MRRAGKRCAVLLAGACVATAGAEDHAHRNSRVSLECQREAAWLEQTIDRLRAEASALREQVADQREACEAQDAISPVAIMSRSWRIAADFGHALLGKAGPHLEGMATQAKVAGSEAWEAVREHVEPHAFTASKVARPYVEDYIAPAAAAAWKESAPKLTQAAEELGRIAAIPLDALFEAAAEISPESRTLLPKQALERALLLFFVLLLSYGFGRLCLTVVPWVLSFVGYLLWVATCGCCCCRCCGCCSRRQVPPTANGEDNAPRAGQSVSVSEATALLEAARQDGNLQAGARALARCARSGIPLTKPDAMRGMMLREDTVNQAAAKFRELDGGGWRS